MPALFGSIFWKMGDRVGDLGDRMSAYSLMIMFQAFIAFDQARGRSHPLSRRGARARPPSRARAHPRALPL